MRNDSSLDWWKRRRVQWPLGALLVLGVAAGLAISRSNASRIVVYNETGHPLEALSITACGQSRTFHDLGERESVRLKLAANGGASDIAIATNGIAMWRGDYIEPRGGYHAIVRLRRDGQVESTTITSWWQTLLGARTTLTP